MQHEIEIFIEHPMIGRPVPVHPVLAGNRGEPQARRLLPWCRGGAGLAGRALGILGAKAIPVGTSGLEATDLDMHRMRDLRHRQGDAGPHDILQTFVAGHLPRDLDGRVAHAAISRLGIANQACPQHDAVRPGIARGDPEREEAA